MSADGYRYLAFFFGFLLLLGGFASFIALQKLGGFKVVMAKFAQRGMTAEYQHYLSVYESLPIPEGATVMLGNSLTAYAPWHELLGDSSIINRGIPGDGVEGVMRRLPSILAAQPKRIFVCIGINDLPYHSTDWLIERHDSLISVLSQQTDCQIIIQSILPVNNTIAYVGIDNEDIQKVNEALQLNTQNHALEYLDLYPFFADRNNRLKAEYTADGIHLNGAGYQQWKLQLSDFF